MGFKTTIDWYDNNAKKYYDKTISLIPYRVIKSFINLLPYNGKVLDAGCGYGRDTNILNKHNVDTYGVDISNSLINLGKSIYPHLKLMNSNFINLPFNNNYFIGIWAHASLVHLESIDDVKNTLKEFYRVLDNKGILYLSVKKSINKVKYNDVKDNISGNDYRFFQYFNKRELKELLNINGFKILKMYTTNDYKWIRCFASKN